MIITRTKFKDDRIIVYTDKFPLIGFNILIDSVNNKQELETAVQTRVDKETARGSIETQRLIKYQSLKI